MESPTDDTAVEAQPSTTRAETATARPPMAQGDPHDETDSENAPPDPDDLVHLRIASNGTSWVFNMKSAFEAAGIKAGAHVEPDLLWERGEPLLLFGELPEDDVEDARYARKVSDRGASWSVKPPRELIEKDPEFGLGISMDDYSNDDPLCFDVMTEDGVVGLLPVGYKSDLEEARSEDATGAAESTTPEESAAAPDEEVSLPVSEDAVAAAAQATGVTTATLRDALAAIATNVDADDIDTAADYEPLDVDDRRVFVVPGRVWDDVQDDLGLEDAVAEAAKLAHTRTAEDLVVEAGAHEYRRFGREYDALVVETS